MKLVTIVTMGLLALLANGYFVEADDKKHNKRQKANYIAFGDSLTDIGKTYEYSNGAWPVKSAYPKHAFTDEETWFYYLKGMPACSKAEQKCDTKVKLSNYAIGAATTDASFIQGYTGPASTWPVPGAQQQLEMYQYVQSHDFERQKTFFVLAGANDMYFQWINGQSIGSDTFAAAVTKNIGNIVKKIAQYYQNDIGGVNIVVFNSYPIETVPFMLPYLSADVLQATQKFNHFLDLELAAVRQNLTASVTLREFDLSNTIYTLLHDGPSMGVSTNTSCVDSTTGTVCDKPGKYLYYDSFHPTSWVHKLIAKKVHQLLY